MRVHRAGEGCGGSGVRGKAQGAADSIPGATSLLSARGGVKAGAGDDEHESLPAARPSVARTRPSAPTARPPAPTATPSALAGGSRGGRGRAPQGGRHRGGQAAWKRGPARGRPTPPLRWDSGAGQNTAKETQPDACAGACFRACVGACARACVGACAGAYAGACARVCSRHVSRMPTPLATQAPDELGLKATLQWEPPCGDVGLDKTQEGKEPSCGSGCRDRSGTEGTTEGQPTQGREWCFIGQGSRLSSKQAWRFSPAPRGYVHLFVPRKKAWERRFAWPQALKRWPRRLFAIKLRIMMV